MTAGTPTSSNEVTPESDDVVLYKHRYGGFFETDLDAILVARQKQSAPVYHEATTTPQCW